MKDGQEIAWVFLRPIAMGIIIGLLWSVADALGSIRTDLRRIATCAAFQKAQK